MNTQRAYLRVLVPETGLADQVSGEAAALSGLSSEDVLSLFAPGEED